MELEQSADPKRQAMLERMAKARAARAAKLAAQLTEPADAPAPKRKRRKHRSLRGRRALLMEIEKQKKTKAEARAAKSAPAGNLFAGIAHQPNGCPTACNAERCVITGDNICQHPDMGGLQAYYLTEKFADVRSRFNAAKMELLRLDTERAKKG